MQYLLQAYSNIYGEKNKVSSNLVIVFLIIKIGNSNQVLSIDFKFRICILYLGCFKLLSF